MFLYSHIQLLERLVGYKVDNIALEKPFHGRRIDLCGSIDSKALFVETQLNKMDASHLKQIRFIMEKVRDNEEIILLWIVSESNQNLIKKVENYLKDHPKNIEFICIEINQELIKKLGPFTRLKRINIKEDFKVLLKHSKLTILFRFYLKALPLVHPKIEIPLNDTATRKLKIMEEILDEMRVQLRDYPNIHKYKFLKNNIINLGSGKSDISFEAGINKYDEVFVQIRFAQKSKSVFHRLYKNKSIIDDDLDFQLLWDNTNCKIYSVYPYKDDTQIVIKRQVRLLCKMMEYFHHEILFEEVC